MSNFISYYDLLNSRHQFRKSGTNSGSDFNLYDTPSHKYFKIFFYFDNGDVEGASSSSDNGLLSPTWLRSYVDVTNYYMYNSAWSYLQMNDEVDRANLLKNFVNLLSNISSESPWYFSEISGLDSALERKQVMSENFLIESTRPKITIKCLPDSFDDRIGVLLDMYRTIVWDWKTKREILPSNLRKFDMGILLFETPNGYFHARKNARNSKPTISLDSTTEKLKLDEIEYSMAYASAGEMRTSYKYIELHNCEIDYGSSKTPYSSLNNKDGLSPEYTIDIHFDDCYESRYNEFAVSEFGDYIIDILGKDKVEDGVSKNFAKATQYEASIAATGAEDNSHGIANTWDNPYATRSRRLDGFPAAPKVKKEGFLMNAVDQLVSTGMSVVDSFFKKAVLGNLYTFSLTRIGSQLKQLGQGDILTSVRNVEEYVRDHKHRNPGDKPIGENMFPDTDYTMGKPSGSLYETPNNQSGTLSPSFMEPAGYEMGQPIGSLPGEVKPKEQHKQSEMFEKNTQVWSEAEQKTMYQKKKIKPSVKYISNLYQGNTIANNL